MKNSISIFAISDTHNQMKSFCRKIIEANIAADLFIHAGDFTNGGSPQECSKFFNSLTEIADRFTKFIIIPGNHDVHFDNYQVRIPAQLKPKLEILCNKMFEFESFLIFGNCAMPDLNAGHRFFQEDSGKWPDEVNLSNAHVVISHCPPFNILDLTLENNHIGSVTLANIIKKSDTVKCVIFGHVHEARGQFQDNKTTFFNVAAVQENMYFYKNSLCLFKLYKSGQVETLLV